MARTADLRVCEPGGPEKIPFAADHPYQERGRLAWQLMKARDEGVLRRVQQIPVTLTQPRERRAEVLQVVERSGMKHGRSVVRRSPHRPSRAPATPVLYTLQDKGGPRATVVDSTGGSLAERRARDLCHSMDYRGRSRERNRSRRRNGRRDNDARPLPGWR